MPQGVPLGNRPSGRRHLLVMNPDPNELQNQRWIKPYYKY